MTGWRRALCVAFPGLLSCADPVDACWNQEDLPQRKACLAEVLIDQEGPALEGLDPAQRDERWLALAKAQRSCLLCDEIEDPGLRGQCADATVGPPHMIDSQPASCPAPRHAACPCSVEGMDLVGYGQYLAARVVRVKGDAAEAVEGYRGDLKRCIDAAVLSCPCLHGEFSARTRYKDGALRSLEVLLPLDPRVYSLPTAQACLESRLRALDVPPDLSGEATWEVTF